MGRRSNQEFPTAAEKNISREKSSFVNETSASAASAATAFDANFTATATADQDSIKYVLDLFPNLESGYVRV